MCKKYLKTHNLITSQCKAEKFKIEDSHLGHFFYYRKYIKKITHSALHFFNRPLQV